MDVVKLPESSSEMKEPLSQLLEVPWTEPSSLSPLWALGTATA